MESKCSTLVFVLILSVLVFSGCGPATAQPTEPPTATPVDVPTSPPEATSVPEPTSEPLPTSTPGPDVLYEGISFSYDDTLAAEVVAETVPAVGPDGVAEWEVEPEHFRLSFDGYILPETFHEPQIVVYPVSEFEASSEAAANTIAALRQFLAEKPATPDGIPFLPLFNAVQMMRTQASYISFQNGAGVCFVTQYGQAYVPINNQEMFYTFQGMTDDGSYYVAAILPVSHPTLPAAVTEDPGDDFRDNFDSYIQEIEQRLDAEDMSSFTPDLSLLDTMIQSLEVAVEIPDTEQSTEDWLVYVNDVYGYQFSYPASATITETGVDGFPTDELPEGMSAGEYMVQLRETYTDKLCVSVSYELGYINISAPPNQGFRYAICGRTGRAYGGVGKSDIIVIEGQSYTAAGYEEIGPGETLMYHNETLIVSLADGTRIEYGAAPSETATFEDYLETTRDVLLQIVASYEQRATSTPPPGTLEDPYPGWASYTNTDYGFAFRHPPAWVVQEGPNVVTLSQQTLTLVIGYRRVAEDVRLGLVGLPAGDFETRGAMIFLGQELRRDVLVYDGKDKAVHYNGTAGVQIGGLEFSISLHEFTADYQAIAILEASQAVVDQIVESFELTE